MNIDNQSVLSAGHSTSNTEGNSQRPAPTTSVPTDLRVNTTALNAVALSNVAKYWVLTNLLPGPIPQVSVYGLPGANRDSQGKVSQDGMLSQHAGLLQADPLLIQQHTQIPVSIATSQGNLGISAGIQLENTHGMSNHHQNGNVTSQNHNQISRDVRMPQSHQQNQQHSGQQNMVQVQVQDNLVSVIEDSKDQKDIISAQLQAIQAAQLHLSENQLNQQALTVQQLQHLQVQQVLDNVVRMENSENNQHQSNSEAEALSETIQIVKDEKTFQNCKLLPGTQFGLQDIKANMMDVRTADGSIVKIQTNMQEQELVKTLGVDIVNNMYKVNVDDLNQLLAYHEIFGKLQGGQGGEISSTSQNVGQPNLNISNSNITIVTKDEQEPSTSNVNIENIPVVGTHTCDLCGKMFQFRYQLIVHRRYHTERKPFTCQVLPDKSCDIDIEKTLGTLLNPQDNPSIQVRALQIELLKKLEEAAEKQEEDENKRALVALAKYNDLPEHKRNLEALARAGYIKTLPDEEDADANYKRSIANLAKNGQLPTRKEDRKRGIESLARNGDLHQNREMLEPQQDAYLARSLVKNYNFPYNTKRSLSSLAKSGDLYSRQSSAKRNIAALAREGMIPGKRYGGSQIYYNSEIPFNELERMNNHYENGHYFSPNDQNIDYNFIQDLNAAQGPSNYEKRFLGRLPQMGKPKSTPTPNTH
ncbi:uncharacterized protein isoform X4 [Leptinotarsa decemlineata]|uniref:uncharacterized protein isoform X4 n=1 Tax=Leptinotarsa decemlineata TaxID=7539 RepID=UPI003D306466